MRRVRRRWRVGGGIACLVAILAIAAPIAAAGPRAGAAGAASPAGSAKATMSCASSRFFCTEVDDSENVFGDGHYVGHDEPATLFYSNTPGAGNDNTYLLRLPKDPAAQPVQDGSGSTWNFQLHPAFWFGMAMCDDQSAPAPGANAKCKRDSDTNIYTSTDPNSPAYIGKHPGAGFMEMQFYPPGWVSQPTGNGCDPTKWCAALNIDSLSQNYNTGAVNNAACLNSAGIEYVNFAFLTKDGKSTTPADPTNGARFNLDQARDYFMNSGDSLAVHMFDTPSGFRVDVADLSNGTHGSMTASKQNGFAQVAFQPTATTCTTIPSDYHPMYSTSSENTRVPWAAHSYNTAFSDETGHFEYCAASDPGTQNCTQSAGTEPLDADDNFCFNASDSSLVKIGGCVGGNPVTDDDYDGVPYQKTWPGSGATKPTPEPIIFSSPVIHGFRPFDRVAFETDLPRIEDNDTLAHPCNRTTGANCVNPPPGANFYPMFTTRNVGPACVWQEGGAAIPGTTRTFGGSSTTEFGPLLPLTYPRPTGPVTLFNDFRQVLPNNPCTLFGGIRAGATPLM
ncbi:hypothetical protein ABH935_000206 [Catenulispora sp. GAS73]|uniref:hypothetical protein n=1 Tax=Catenulispora sp. GAS73 TaxID=3156269 RepID=UPI003517C8AF